MSKRVKKTTARSPTATRTARPPTATRTETTTTARPPATASSSVGTITETTLFCLAHGEPPSSYFKIKVGNNDDIDDLRKLIRKESEPDFDDYAPWKLKLWIVDIPFSSQNLGDSSVNIANVLQGRAFLPPNKVRDIFPTQPPLDRIHVIVEVPTPAARRNDDVIIAKLDRIGKDVEDIKREKSSVQISGVTEGYWTKIQEFTGLDYQVTTREIEFPNLNLELRNERIDTFRWADAIERSQNDRYKPYLTNILRLGTFRTLGLYDPTGDDSFLSTNTDILPIRLSGTTDLVIVDRHSIASRAQEKHIRVLFELNKVVNKKHTFQTMAELISADLKSKHPVLAVLTDLIDDWNFFWIKEKIIMRLNLSRDESVALIRHNLTSANNELSELANQASSERPQRSSEMDIETSSSEEEPSPKRHKLRHVITTSNVRSDIAPMEDFFDTMSEEEIFRYKAKQILTQFFSQPIFNGLNDQEKIPLQSDNEKNILD